MAEYVQRYLFRVRVAIVSWVTGHRSPSESRSAFAGTYARARPTTLGVMGRPL